ncbi:tigger transposable element-derived protein 6-like protein [Elysia marginata]|uniref:Tigger transposable element-derived protein 6-like protein n=1 Tax=Elysia marginata TaxID=1093978 RepID=A0AAV4HQH5_9GAST|nr:tigger transposable element-derived protein 6-like protein [Elysia marginata]
MVQHILNREGRKTPFHNNLPERKWVKSFMERHPGLSEKKTSVLGEQRADLTKERLQSWFKEVADNLEVDEVDITTADPACIFNADETRLPLTTKCLPW